MRPNIAFRIVGYSNELVKLTGVSLPSLKLIENMAFPLFIVGLFFIIIAEIKRFRIKYIFYDDRLVKEIGILITDIQDVSYDHIDYFHTKRSLMQKILGTADLNFKTPSDKKTIVLSGVGKPEKWAEFVMKKAKNT